MDLIELILLSLKISISGALHDSLILYWILKFGPDTKVYSLCIKNLSGCDFVILDMHLIELILLSLKISISGALHDSLILYWILKFGPDTKVYSLCIKNLELVWLCDFTHASDRVGPTESKNINIRCIAWFVDFILNFKIWSWYQSL